MLRQEFKEILLEYFAASQATLFDLTKKSRSGEITAMQYSILEYLYFHDGSGLSSLAECMNLSLPNASRECRKLIEKKLLKKESDQEDKRKTYFFMTKASLEMMDRSFRKMMTNLEDDLVTLSNDDQVELEKYLKIIMEKLFSKKKD